MEICEDANDQQFYRSSNDDTDNSEDKSNAFSSREGEICLSIRTSIEEVLEEIRNNQGSVIGDYTIPTSFRLDTKWEDVLKALQVPFDPEKHVLKGHGKKIQMNDTVETFYEMYSRRLPYYTVTLTLAGKDGKQRKCIPKKQQLHPSALHTESLETANVNSTTGVRRSKRQGIRLKRSKMSKIKLERQLSFTESASSDASMSISNQVHCDLKDATITTEHCRSLPNNSLNGEVEGQAKKKKLSLDPYVTVITDNRTLDQKQEHFEPLKYDTHEYHSQTQQSNVTFTVPVTAFVIGQVGMNGNMNSFAQNKLDNLTLRSDTSNEFKPGQSNSPSKKSNSFHDEQWKPVHQRGIDVVQFDTHGSEISQISRPERSDKSEIQGSKLMRVLQRLESANCTNTVTQHLYSSTNEPEKVSLPQETESFRASTSNDSSALVQDNNRPNLQEKDEPLKTLEVQQTKSSVKDQDAGVTKPSTSTFIPKESSGGQSGIADSIEILQSEDSHSSDCCLISEEEVKDSGVSGDNKGQTKTQSSQDIVIKPHLLSFINRHYTNKDLNKVYKELLELSTDNQIHKLGDLAPLTSIFLTSIFNNKQILKQLTEDSSESQSKSEPTTLADNSVSANLTSSSTSTSSSTALEIAEEIEISSSPLPKPATSADATSMSDCLHD